MSTNNFLTILIGVSCLTVNVRSSVVVYYDLPHVAQLKVGYIFMIININMMDKTPFENFVISLEIINPVSQEIIGVLAIKSKYSVDDQTGGLSFSNFTIQPLFIAMRLYFTLKAKNQLFQIRFGRYETEIEKETFFNDNNKDIIFKKIMFIYVPYEIELINQPGEDVVSYKDMKKFGPHLLPGRKGVIFCTARVSRIIAEIYPQFLNPVILNSGYVRKLNPGRIVLRLVPEITDHGKIIQCRAGINVMELRLTVYHYTSEVSPIPNVDKQAPINRKIQCHSNGYPTPTTAWTFISGPDSANNFYELQDNNATLFFKLTAPINSSWSFECQGSNEMPPMAQKFFTAPSDFPITKVFNFTLSQIKTNGISSCIISELIISLSNFVILFVAVN